MASDRITADEYRALAKPAKFKAGWYEFAEKKIYMRSKWEYNYGLILDKRKAAGIIEQWEYEPITFWFSGIKRGTNSYKPDFRITWPDGKQEYQEIKGWMDKKSATKIKRMAKYHPDIKLIVICKAQYDLIMARGI